MTGNYCNNLTGPARQGSLGWKGQRHETPTDPGQQIQISDFYVPSESQGIPNLRMIRS